MRESSSNLSKQNSQKPKDIRGGEKKVMKKSLSAIVSMAMAFSMFSSVAFGAEAAKDSSAFSDLTSLDAATKAKFDAMISAGVFDGVKEGTFGLNDKMNRAQFAKVAALIFGLKVDTSLKTSSFTDVKSDDPANGYALPYIEAVKAAGITDGYAPGQYNPAGEVTKEQLAAFLVRGLGWETQAKATPGVSDKTVSDWAKGYVALAIEKKVLTSGADGTFGGTSAAVRSQLVLGAYEAKQQYVPPVGPVVTNVSIAKAEATGAKTIKVTLNGAIADTSKLTVSVNRGGAAIASTVKWNESKNEATVTLEGKMTEGTYTAKIEAVKDGGLTVEKGAVDVAVQNEKVTKIEFLNASETVSQSNKVKISFKATNQYNEVTDMAASRFNIVTSPNLSTVVAGDSQSITVNVYAAVTASPALLVRDQMFAVTIVSPDNTAQASKTFKVGDKQSIAKVELGDMKFNNGKTQLEAGDTATIEYKAFDQYGFEVTDLAALLEGTSTYNTGAGTIVNTTVTRAGLQANGGFDFVEDENGDNKPELKVVAAEASTTALFNDQEVALSIVAHGSGQTASKNVKVVAPKVPHEIAFGAFNKTLAWGDDDQFVPVIVKDKFGNVLSTDDVVKYAADINVYGYGTAGVTVGQIETTGADRGKVRVSGLKPSDASGRKSGNLTINAMVTKTGKSATYSTSVLEYRYPNSVYVSSAAKDKILPNAESAFKLKFKDQYGEDLDKNFTNYKLELSLQRTSGTVVDGVYAYLNEADSTNAKKQIREANTEAAPLVIDGAGIDKENIKDLIRDKEIKFKTLGTDLVSEGTYTLKAKLVNKTNGTSVTSTSTIDRIKADKANDLTYAITPFATGIYAVDKLASQTASPVDAETSTWFNGKVEVTAKDANGKTVALPGLSTMVKNVGLSNPTVAKSEWKKKQGDATEETQNDVLSVRGLKAGTTGITVTFEPTAGNTKFATLENVTISEDAPVASSLTAAENGKGKNISLTQLKSGSLSVFDGTYKTFGDVKIKDQYNSIELKNYSVVRTASVLGTQFIVSDVKQNTDTGYQVVTPATVTITAVEANGTAVYTYTAGTQTNGTTTKALEVLSFKASIVTANGKSQFVEVYPVN
jgi:trimeric autotransporter adhesin